MKRPIHILASAALTILIIAGCTPLETKNEVTESPALDSTAQTEYQQRLSRLEAELIKKERALAELEAEARKNDAKSQRSASTKTSIPPPPSSGNGLLPPDPKPGECYARVIIPDQFETVTEEVLQKEASEKIDIMPAVYESAEEEIVVREGSTRIEVEPAQYETIEEKVLVKPASTQIIQVPAKYRTETVQVVDVPAHTEWKRATGVGSASGAAGSGVDQSTAGKIVERFSGQNVLETRVEDTGEVMCLVEVPATYKTITRQVLESPARTEKVEIPAEYRMVSRRVLVKPASIREVEVPPEYRKVPVTRLVKPAEEIRETIPAEYVTVERQEKVSEARVEWRPVLCEVNMVESNITKLQNALKKEGCYRCKVDGRMGPCTLRGAKCYAQANNLPYGDNYITTQLIRSLGLQF